MPPGTGGTGSAAPPGAPAGAYGVFGLTLLLGLGWVVLALTHLDDHARNADLPYSWGTLLLSFGLGLSGLFILAHRSGHPLGRLLSAVGLLTIAGRFLLFLFSVTRAGSGWLDLGMLVLITSAAALIFALLALPLWFPDGRLPGGRIGRGYLALLALWSIVQGYYDHAGTRAFYGAHNPLRHGDWARLHTRLADALDGRVFWIDLALVLLGLLVAAVRWWRSPGARPQQWLVLLPWGIWVTLTFVYSKLNPTTLGYFILYSVVAAIWPLAPALGFARDRSWQLDRQTRRVLTSFTLLALLIFGYFVLALELPKMLPRADSADAQLMAGCALLVGVLLRPTTRLVSRAVERFYYGERARPYQVARKLAERLSQAAGTTEAPSLLCQTAVGNLGLPGARVTVATRGGPRELAALGATGPGAEVFPIAFEGAEIGELHAQPRSGQPLLDRQDRVVLRFLVDESAPAIASLRLTEELQSSRKQLVLAREEERKRLRHDLHDGLGPALSGLRLQIDTARSGLPPEGRWRPRCGPPRWASAPRSTSCAGSPTAWRPPTSAGSA
ncbi:hypothetical protein E6W39_31955 [Kitasatospora acidiphila]|uniref:Uncharacterized protein n=1 Tax=Kitasatospora acidiphila TaxID=2567942 RepID=A0A540WAG8_9ACTN|nr:histidine kinase dimerization/phosphoacceptor domain-containing protein [Kitasatospora acidiphila]TQF05998.1 hypothetical protein E6W39_31955 [Kitasatospora acidiphila]